MHKMIFAVGGFILGAAGGSVATYFIVKEKFHKKASQEIEEMREYYRKLKSELKQEKKASLETKNVSEDSSDKKPTPTPKNPVNDKEIYEKYKTGNSYYAAMSNYSVSQKPSLEELAKEKLGVDISLEEDKTDALTDLKGEELLGSLETPPEDEPKEDYDDDEDEYGKLLEEAGITEFDDEYNRMNTNPKLTPYLIPEQEYIDHPSPFPQATISYYPVDDTLADTDESIMTQDVVGQEALDILRRGDADCVYVRNEKLAMEYEIVCSLGSYSEIVLGIHQPPTYEKIYRTRKNDEDN